MQPRQLIVCCDGTNNNLTGGKADTNVVKSLRWMGGPGSNQVVFYDPGVGNAGMLPGATIWDEIVRTSERIAGLALGRGVYENIAEGYQFLMFNYQPGDELYFFGFSRGAFTARSIAGMVNQFGILRPHMQTLLPTLLHIYFSSRTGDRKAGVDAVTEQIRKNFCSELQWQPPLHFTGVWDTVASVGMWPFAARMTARPTIKGKRFVHVRQALALDEHRVPFAPRIYLDSPGEVGEHQTVVQRWFRGAHCDAGGGYLPERSVISNEALAWMLVEAAGCGLRLDQAQVPQVTRDAVVEALASGLTGLKPIVHSETYYNCLWAVGGLTVRKTNAVEIEGQPDEPVIAVEHESVGQPLLFPKNTVWAEPRPVKEKIGLVILVALAAILWFGMGRLLSAGEATTISEWLMGAVKANVSLQAWQLGWWSGEIAAPRFSHPFAALAADLLFIACYAYVLAWWIAWSFARVAHFNRANLAPRAMLAVLGRALPVMVYADIAEDIFTFLTLGLAPKVGPLIWYPLGVAMSAASAVKWVGALGVVTLLAWSLVTRPNRPLVDPSERIT